MILSEDETILVNVEDQEIIRGHFTVPESVVQIGDMAFSGCENLSTISLPEGLTQIGKHAFLSCKNLTTINIPEDVTHIGDGAFRNCKSLTAVNLPKSVTHISDKTFLYCGSLTRINIPEGVTHIGKHVFSYCRSLTEIYVPDSVTHIGEHAFLCCNRLTRINIPEGVTQIGDEQFSDCLSLTRINIPESVTQIGKFAFSNCPSLTTINIPKNVTHIEAYAFAICSNLTKINFPESMGQIQIDDLAFLQCSSLIAISLPEDIAAIHNDAFKDCHNLRAIIFDVSDEASIERLKAFFPDHLQDKCIRKTLYDKTFNEIEKALEKLNRTPEISPLYFSEHEVLCNDVLAWINVFQGANNPYKDAAKNKIDTIPYPRSNSDADLGIYKNKLENIVEEQINQAKKQALEKGYQAFKHRFSASTPFKKFFHGINELTKKHENLKSRGEDDAARASDVLLLTLKSAYIAYVSDHRRAKNTESQTNSLEKFKVTCYQAIHTASPELEKHRGWKEILVNLSIAILLLGIPFLINGASTKGKHFFFHPATDSSKILKNLEDHIDCLSPKTS